MPFRAIEYNLGDQRAPRKTYVLSFLTGAPLGPTGVRVLSTNAAVAANRFAQIVAVSKSGRVVGILVGTVDTVILRRMIHFVVRNSCGTLSDEYIGSQNPFLFTNDHLECDILLSLIFSDFNTSST